MHVLIIKTSSLGDIIHLLPAVTDAQKNIPNISFDWVAEEAFAEIPTWHPAVERVIPIALRRWRKTLLKTDNRGEWKNFYGELRSKSYDRVIDAQGLIKSAGVTWLSRGKRCGLDRHSVWESLASMAYQEKYAVNPDQHAITRMRQLFASALNYTVPTDCPDYGIDRNRFSSAKLELPKPLENYLVFLHGTTDPKKYWPKESWINLAQLATANNYPVLLPWGNAEERERAEEIAACSDNAYVLPRLNLAKIAAILANAKATVAVDTGLGHLSAALDMPTLSLYGHTDPALIGTMGQHQLHLDATMSAETVWKQLQTLIVC